MRRQHTTKTGKAMRMKFSCIISGCPEGARKWHIQIFAMFYIANISIIIPYRAGKSQESGNAFQMGGLVRPEREMGRIFRYKRGVDADNTPIVSSHQSKERFEDMKATGIVRRIDDLGRVVIPKEIRRTMRIREGDPLLKTLTVEERAFQYITNLGKRLGC